MLVTFYYHTGKVFKWTWQLEKRLVYTTIYILFSIRADNSSVHSFITTSQMYNFYFTLFNFFGTNSGVFLVIYYIPASFKSLKKIHYVFILQSILQSKQMRLNIKHYAILSCIYSHFNINFNYIE